MDNEEDDNSRSTTFCTTKPGDRGVKVLPDVLTSPSNLFYPFHDGWLS